MKMIWFQIILLVIYLAFLLSIFAMCKAVIRRIYPQ